MMDAQMMDVGPVYEFTEDETKILNSTSMYKQFDALFVRHVLEFLYKDDLHVLENRSCSGRTRKSRKSNNNEVTEEVVLNKALTPEKKKIIFNEFSKRIEKCNIPTEQKLIRLDSKYISRQILTAIGTVRKNISKPKA